MAGDAVEREEAVKRESFRDFHQRVEAWVKEGEQLANDYASARLEDRSRLLRDYVGRGFGYADMWLRRGFADGLAADAGFSRKEIRDLRHLVDGESPAAGWCGYRLNGRGKE